MQYLPFSYWGGGASSINANGLTFFLPVTSFVGSGLWYDVSGNGNHAYVSGAVMGNDNVGWRFDGTTFASASNSLVWSGSLTATPSSSWTLQIYGKLWAEPQPQSGDPVPRVWWRTTNETEDLSGSGWSITYQNTNFVDIGVIKYSGSTATSQDNFTNLPYPNYFNGNTASVFSITFNNNTQSLYIDDNIVSSGETYVTLSEFTGSTSGLKYPLTFGKAPLHTRTDYFTWYNPIGKVTKLGWVDENHNFQEYTVGGSETYGVFTWPNSALYYVDGWQGVLSGPSYNAGNPITSSVIEPLIVSPLGVSGSINALLLYNRVLQPNEIANNAKILKQQEALVPNILPGPTAPTAITSSEANLSLHLDAANGYWYNQRTWYDISGNGNNLTLSGSVTYDITTGSVGFFGDPSSYFRRRSGITGLNLAATASCEVWLKWWTATDNNAVRTAFSMGSGSVLSCVYADSFNSGTLGYFYGTQNNNNNIIPNSGSAHNYTKDNSNNIWRQAVMVKSGDTIDFYVNGSYQASKSGFSSTIVSGSRDIRISGDWLGATNTYNYFIGEVGIVKVWNGKALTSTEISASFASKRTRFGI